MAKDTARVARRKRHLRVRAKVKGTASAPRLCVFRSLNNIYAQVIDDGLGHTLAAASTLDEEIRESLAGKTKTGRSELVGSLVARRALDKGVNRVAFDRGGFKYHGRVKALAEAARQGGLKF
ncbi:MAG: 50S ribosomal protein L18 [Dehalococcoidales bacterium]